MPISRAVTGWPMYMQTTLLEKLGMASDYPTSADDFKALTNPDQNRWAFGVTNDTTIGPYSMTWFQGIVGAPNNWRVNTDGSLVKEIETEEYRAALGYLRELVQLGYCSPDVKANADVSNDMFGGKIVMRAPFGSEEYMITKFGVEGKDFNFDANGAPVYTDQGLVDLPGGPNTCQWGYLGTSTLYLYSPTVPEYGKFASDEERKLIEVGVSDPTLGHYSPADAKLGAQLSRLIFDRVSDIAAGRQPLSALDQLIQDWKAQGGDKIRAEYAQSLSG